MSTLDHHQAASQPEQARLGRRAQRRTGRALHSNAVVADGTQTMLCAWLSAALLVGLLLNATLGWSWADPIVGLVIAAVAAREGVQAWQGQGCCAPISSTTPADPNGHSKADDCCGPGCANGCRCG